MTLSIGIILFLAVLFWTVSARYEWNIPLNWQILIRAWKEQLCNKSQPVFCRLELDPEKEEMENRLRLIKKALPGLYKNYKLPFWLEVRIYSNLPLGQNEKYIASLQRRFSEIKILGLLNDKRDGARNSQD